MRWILVVTAALGAVGIGLPAAASPVAGDAVTTHLRVLTSANRSSYTPGRDLSLTVKVTNGGPDAAVGARILDRLPPPARGFTWVCRAFAGATCHTGHGTGPIDLVVDLPAGSEVKVRFHGHIASNVRLDPLVHRATVVAPDGVTDPGCDPACTDRDEVPLRIRTSPRVSMTASRDSYRAPGPLTYTVRVRNGGPSDAAGLRLRDMVPPPLSAFEWRCTGPGVSGCDIPDDSAPIDTRVYVAAGRIVTIRLSGTVPSRTTGLLTNTVTLSSPDCRPGRCRATVVLRKFVPLADTGTPTWPLAAAGALFVAAGLGLRAASRCAP